MKAVVARFTSTLGIFKTFQANLQSQAPELSAAPRGIPTCRHVWELPGSGDESPAPKRMLAWPKDRERPEGSAQGASPNTGRILDSEFVKSGLQIKCSQNSKARRGPANKVIPPSGRYLV